MSSFPDKARAHSGALLFWQCANIALATLTGFVLRGPGGAGFGFLLGFAFVLTPAAAAHARAIGGRAWRMAQPRAATALQRVANSLPALLRRLSVRRERS